MLSLTLALLLAWFVLAVLLAAWTLFLQGYIYSEPVEQVFWRAPAAAAALTLFFAFWCLLAVKSPGRYDILTQFSDTETDPPCKELTAVVEGKEEVFKLSHGADGRWQYRRGSRVMPSRPQKLIIVRDNGQREEFVPDTDAAGHFKNDPNRSLRYWDATKKRWMDDGFLGQVETFRPGWLIGNLLLNFCHLAVWFLTLWLLLQFQWSHALGQAAVFWIATMLFVVPPLLDRAAKLATAHTTG